MEQDFRSSLCQAYSPGRKLHCNCNNFRSDLQKNLEEVLVYNLSYTLVKFDDVLLKTGMLKEYEDKIEFIEKMSAQKECCKSCLEKNSKVDIPVNCGD